MVPLALRLHDEQVKQRYDGCIVDLELVGLQESQVSREVLVLEVSMSTLVQWW